MPWNPDQADTSGSRTKDWADYQNFRKTNRVGNTYQDLATFGVRGTLGGIAGQAEGIGANASGNGSAGGNDLLGIHVGDGTTINDNMTEDVYNSMSADEWNAFAHMTRAQQDQFIVRRSKEAGKYYNDKRESDKAAAAQAAEEAKYKAWRESALQRLDKFSQEMGKPLDQLLREGDAGAQAATTTGANQAATAAYGRGIGGGGLSTANTQRAFLDAGQGYTLQRQQMGAQATQGLLQGLQGEYMNGEDRRRYEQGLNLQLQQAQAGAYNQQYQQHSQQAGGTLGLIGAGVGAYFGGAAGAQAGYSLGSGIGSQNYQNQNPYQAPQYKYPSSTNTGLSGGRFGGSQ